MRSEMFGPLEGIMKLTIRHGSGLKPPVEYFRSPFHRAPARTRIHNRVQVFLVQVRNRMSGAFFNFLYGTEHFAFLTGSTFPDWNGRCPVSIARNIPVAR